MKIIMGVVPCKDRFFLDKAIDVVRPALEELIAMTDGESNFFQVATELYSGTMQLCMVYKDEHETPEDKEQAMVIHKLLAGGKQDYIGYCIIQLWPNSFHVYQVYLLPEYRNQGVLKQGADKVEKQARLLGAPYISFCTSLDDNMMQHFGFKRTYTTYRKKL